MLSVATEFNLRGEECIKSTGSVMILVVCEVWRVFRDKRLLVKVDDREPDGVWAVARTVVVRDAAFPSYGVGSMARRSKSSPF